MRRRGFTLAELLAVIVVLGLIAVITIPAVTKALGEYKVRLCNEQLKNIEEAARVWGSDNIFSLPEKSGDSIIITLDDLQKGGYIGKKIKNPKNSNNEVSKDLKITITKNNKKIVYTVEDFCIESKS